MGGRGAASGGGGGGGNAGGGKKEAAKSILNGGSNSFDYRGQKQEVSTNGQLYGKSKLQYFNVKYRINNTNSGQKQATYVWNHMTKSWQSPTGIDPFKTALQNHLGLKG